MELLKDVNFLSFLGTVLCFLIVGLTILIGVHLGYKGEEKLKRAEYFKKR